MARSKKLTLRDQLQIIQTDGECVCELFNIYHECNGYVYKHCGIYYAIYNTGYYAVIGKHFDGEHFDGELTARLQTFQTCDVWPEYSNEKSHEQNKKKGK